MASKRSRGPSVSRVLLRLPADLHRLLAGDARRAGVSFNTLCVERLRLAGETNAMSAGHTAVVGRARTLFGNRLAGVIAYGSWARGEAGTSSDVDVLIVVDSSVPLTRDMYRDWDVEPVVADGRIVDAHFVHPGIAGAIPSGVWCEAAIDGIVWYDREGRIAAHLADVRCAIADGRVVRAFAHGQPYWKGAA